MSIEPIDTSTLGPIRIDLNAQAARAHVVREALERFAEGESDRVYGLALALARAASNQALAKLGRMLK